MARGVPKASIDSANRVRSISARARSGSCVRERVGESDRGRHPRPPARRRVLPEVRAAGKALEAYYDSFPDWESLPIPHKDNADVPSPSILAAAKLLPSALGDVERVAHFAVATQTWDGGGGRWSLNELCEPQLVAELQARDEWPHH